VYLACVYLVACVYLACVYLVACVYLACVYLACIYLACVYLACVYLVACIYLACVYIAGVYLACVYLVACVYLACVYLARIYLVACVLIQPVKAIHDLYPETEWRRGGAWSAFHTTFTHMEPYVWPLASIAQTVTVWVRRSPSGWWSWSPSIATSPSACR